MYYDVGEPSEHIKDLIKLIENDPFFELPKVQQIIVNEYKIHQLIGPHIDHHKLFGPVVLSLSLSSSCKFVVGSHIFNLNPRDLVILSSDARYLYKHSLKAHEHTTPRVSITFRSIL